jgi:hypothetical protein
MALSPKGKKQARLGASMTHGNWDSARMPNFEPTTQWLINKLFS